MSTLVGVPVKNAAIWLPKFLAELDRLEEVSRVIFIYGKSMDNTLDLLRTYRDNTPHDVDIFLEAADLNAMSAHQIGGLYQDFQDALSEGKEDYFLLIDCDITEFPPDLIPRLKEHDKDIIAPYIWTHGHTPPKFFDTYCFRYNGGRFHPFNPPNPGKPFELDSIGSCYLAKRAAFFLTPYGDRPHISFCANAREMGFEIWADPTTEVFHLYVEQLGMSRVYPEALENKPPDLTPYIKKDGSLIPLDEMGPDIVFAFIWKEVR